MPAGERKFREVVVGIVATLVLWLVGGIVFGRYLAEFASNYVTYYAGLASVMIALVFLYLTASIFMFGVELNAAIYKTFAYVPNATKVDSPIEEAFETRQGVCQDFAHLMIAILRSF